MKIDVRISRHQLEWVVFANRLKITSSMVKESVFLVFFYRINYQIAAKLRVSMGYVSDRVVTQTNREINCRYL